MKAKNTLLSTNCSRQVLIAFIMENIYIYIYIYIYIHIYLPGFLHLTLFTSLIYVLPSESPVYLCPFLHRMISRCLGEGGRFTSTWLHILLLDGGFSHSDEEIRTRVDMENQGTHQVPLNGYQTGCT